MEINPNEDFSQADIEQIQKLSNDIYQLKCFINLLEQNKSKKIKALYIVTEDGFQIELKGRFSNDASSKLLDLIINSRKSLITMLSSMLADLSQQVKNDAS